MNYFLDSSNFLEEISSLSHSIVFLYLLHCSLKKASSLLAILWTSTFCWVYLSLSLLTPCLMLLFSQLFVKPPQTSTLPSCTSFSFWWFWSLLSVQCYEWKIINTLNVALQFQWTWTWANSKRWWETENPDLLPSMGLPGVRHELAPERQWQQQPWVYKAT